MSYSLPRLSSRAVELMMDKLSSDIPVDAAIAQAKSELDQMVTLPPVGGKSISPEDMRKLLVLPLKDKVGHLLSVEKSNSAQRSEFDKLIAETLGASELLDSGNGYSEGFWIYLACLELPELVVWRWGRNNRRRFEGRERNAFRRLWTRARLVDRGVGREDRWGLLGVLTEDAYQQIVERPSIAADRKLSLTMAEAWARTAKVIGASRMEPVMRRVSISVRLRNRVQLLSSLVQKELEKVIANEFAVAVRELGLEVPEGKLGQSSSLKADKRKKEIGGKGKNKFRGFFGLGRRN